MSGPGPAAAPDAAGVLYADADLLVVDKPAGRLVIPGRAPSAADESLREGLERVHGKLWVVHRLDRNTSGVLAFARSAAAHRALNLAFERGEPAKRYLALVRGPAPAERRIDVPIAAGRKGRMRPAEPGDARGKPSVTVVRTLERFAGDLALVEALPETGRTHQIRVHLAAIGCPLAVDPDYGEDPPLRGPGGVALLARTPLHAARLALRHPVTGAPLVIEAPLPADLAGALAALRG